MPVYNVERFVGDAIESLKNQTFDDFECIIVNDGSTDSSGKAIENHVDQDPRFKIVNTQNGGLSAARNRGIREISGEFVYFFDSDDVLAPNFLEIVVNELSREKADAVSFDFQEVPEDYNFTQTTPFSVQKRNILGTEDTLMGLMRGNVFQMAWSYVVKSDIVLNSEIKFSEGRLFEDNNFAVKLFARTNRVDRIYADHPPYYCRQRQGSITDISNNKHSLSELKDELFIFKDAHDAFPAEVRRQADRWYFNRLVHLFSKYKPSVGVKDRRMQKMHSDIRRLRRQFRLGPRELIRYSRTQNKLVDFIVRRAYGEKISK